MKNDLTCGVVRDLLPSYVEGLTSPESNTAVERHLSECPDCAQLRTDPVTLRAVQKAIALIELKFTPQEEAH